MKVERGAGQRGRGWAGGSTVTLPAVFSCNLICRLSGPSSWTVGRSRVTHPVRPPVRPWDGLISCLDAVALKRDALWASTCFPQWYYQIPAAELPLLCLISPVNNCSGFTSHHWYSNQCLLWAKQRRGPRGQLLGVFQCVYMQRPARKRLGALLKAL